MKAAVDISRPVRTARQEHAKPSLRIVRNKPRVEPTNNLRAFMFAHRITEAQLVRVTMLTQRSVNMIRNGLTPNPQVGTCWKVVVGLSSLLGYPVEFGAIFPRPEMPS
jgi:hypothetical protein